MRKNIQRRSRARPRARTSSIDGNAGSLAEANRAGRRGSSASSGLDFADGPLVDARGGAGGRRTSLEEAEVLAWMPRSRGELKTPVRSANVSPNVASPRPKTRASCRSPGERGRRCSSRLTDAESPRGRGSKPAARAIAAVFGPASRAERDRLHRRRLAAPCRRRGAQRRVAADGILPTIARRDGVASRRRCGSDGKTRRGSSRAPRRGGCGRRKDASVGGGVDDRRRESGDRPRVDEAAKERATVFRF